MFGNMVSGLVVQEVGNAHGYDISAVYVARRHDLGGDCEGGVYLAGCLRSKGWVLGC